MRKRRQKNKKFKVLVILMWLFVCASMGFFLPQIPVIKNLVQVDKVEIYGSEKVDKDKIKRVFESVSWIFVDKDYVEEEIIKKYPFIKSVNITVVKPGVIRVSLLERKPEAILKYRGRFFIVDEDGYVSPREVFKKFPLNKLKVEIVYNDEVIKEKDIRNISLIKKTLSTFKIKKYIINISQIVCILDNGKTVVFGKENLNNGLKMAKSFFKRVDISEYRYIDFSFNSIVVARR